VWGLFGRWRLALWGCYMKLDYLSYRGKTGI
jgi:hypothetical protein